MTALASWPDYVGAVATAVAAVATVAAVLVALFYQPIQESRRKPRLGLALPDSSAWDFPGASDDLETVTLQITAERGRRSAEEVEVLATAMWAGQGDEPAPEPHVVFDNRPLRWFEGSEIDGRETRIHMAPGVSRRVELFKVGSPQALFHWLGWPDTVGYRTFQGATVAFASGPKPLTVRSSPFVHPHLGWRIRLDVTARDVDTAVFEFNLRVNTDWHGKRESPDSRARVGSKDAPARVATELEFLNFRRLSK